jgi:hypothetical protein
VRLRLRAELRRVVDSVWLLVVPRGRDRLAAVQVHFAGGGWRDYLLLHRPPKANARVRTPGRWYVASARDFDPGDLRDREEARQMEEFLRRYPQDLIERLLAQGHPLP